MSIHKVAVIGAGTMGSGVAALIANSSTEVLLYDIVPKDAASDRNVLAKKGIERQVKAGGFTHPDKVNFITPANLDDDLQKLRECDWILEAITETMDLKLALFSKIRPYINPDTVVSSNTSTIPSHMLSVNLGPELRQNFFVTHFFNPPRYMKLLELVRDEENDPRESKKIKDFIDIKLGKTIIYVNDSPGFIANRIGTFWLYTAVYEAIKQSIPIEEADYILSKPFGIPKTGAFGLMDLIGLDVMEFIAQSLALNLEGSDRFFQLYRPNPIIKNMISTGYTGRKGLGGFYVLNKETKEKQVFDLHTKKYRPVKEPEGIAANKHKHGDINGLLNEQDRIAKYARKVMLDTFAYTASCVPAISSSVHDIDHAMRAGYGWKYGIFEMIDMLSTEDKSGPKALEEMLTAAHIKVPDLISNMKPSEVFYKVENDYQCYYRHGSYHKVTNEKGKTQLRDFKLGYNAIVKKNDSASLVDIGDGVLCLDFNTKMNVYDFKVLELLNEAIDIVAKDYTGLIIGNDEQHFSAGADIALFLECARTGNFTELEELIRCGQHVLLKVKYSHMPVIAAPYGITYGGGCETLLAASAINAHVETYAGLVETNIGVIPAWGGTKEMLLRHEDTKLAFKNIITAKTSASAEDLLDMKFISGNSRITMNRERVLCDSKDLALNMAIDYKAPSKPSITLEKFDLDYKEFIPDCTDHDKVVMDVLYNVFTCGNQADGIKTFTEEEILAKELEGFIELMKTSKTQARIEHTLKTGKSLHN